MPTNRPSRGDIERRAIETYGEPMQMVVCMEECAELIEAICDTFESFIFKRMRTLAKVIKAACKYLRKHPRKVKILETFSMPYRLMHLREELADVTITTDQMRMIFGPTLIEEDAKLTRLAEWLGMEVKG